MAFQGEMPFLQNTQLQLESLPTEEKECYIAPCEWMKKARQFDFIPRLASDFCQPHSSATHICCTTGMTRSTTSVSTAQLLTFLFKPVSCFRSTSLYLPPHANKAQEKTYRKLGTLRQSFFSRKVQGSLWSIVTLSLCNT